MYFGIFIKQMISTVGVLILYIRIGEGFFYYLNNFLEPLVGPRARRLKLDLLENPDACRVQIKPISKYV